MNRINLADRKNRIRWRTIRKWTGHNSPFIIMILFIGGVEGIAFFTAVSPKSFWRLQVIVAMLILNVASIYWKSLENIWRKLRGKKGKL